MNKQQVIAFMDWVEAVIDLKVEEAFGRGLEHEYVKEITLRDELLDLFGFGEGMK